MANFCVFPSSSVTTHYQCLLINTSAVSSLLPPHQQCLLISFLLVNLVSLLIPHCPWYLFIIDMSSLLTTPYCIVNANSSSMPPHQPLSYNCFLIVLDTSSSLIYLPYWWPLIALSMPPPHQCRLINASYSSMLPSRQPRLIIDTSLSLIPLYHWYVLLIDDSSLHC